MEEKLKAAAARLPQPKGDFLAVEEARKHKLSHRSAVRKRRLAVILTALVLLFGCIMTVAATAEVNHSAWVDPIVRPWATVKREMKKLDYEFPKTLGQSQFTQAEHMFFCPPGTKWLAAILNPSYKPTIITYGTEVVKRTGTKQPVMELMFGSTENKYCHQWWELEEDYEPWFIRQDNLLEGTGERLEYEENILYTGTLVNPWEYHTYDIDGNPIDKYGQTHTYYVLWVDTDKNVAACLESKDTDADTLLQYAKDIIDLNKPET